MTAAPLGSVRIEGVHITRDHSAVVLVADESRALREWLWSTTEFYRGKATGNRFRLTVDGVPFEARRVFAKPSMMALHYLLTITSGPGDTAASVFGRKVGKPLHEVELVRTAATRKQGELKAKEPGQKRVTVEEAT